MNTYLTISTLAAVLLTSALATGGGAMAATPHHAYARDHARYASEACSTLSGQWSSARAGERPSPQTRRRPRHQERIGQRDCRSTQGVRAESRRPALPLRPAHDRRQAQHLARSPSER